MSPCKAWLYLAPWVRERRPEPENSVTSIAKLLGISRTTLYKYVPELTAGRDSLIAEDNPILPASRR
ncbi:helix-turn-helix domain-containing protein [Streptomyces sp. PRh5]|uniref:helix-turn-helix domain-containing protein n=1 Tax=Streptomyces sp. PRh5 TaxID=1158056 RepID=UPI000996BE6E|nr:helix-turn-helix domain-containing protein [Streptomyces sp. PRh5]